MLVDRLTQKIKEGKVIIGTTAHSSSPDLIELYAYCGFDFVWFDQMFGPTDWERAAYLINSGRAAGMTVFPRIQAYPWHPNPGIDYRMLSDIARSIGIGATAVLFSASTVEEIKLAIPMGMADGKGAKMYHTKIHIHHDPDENPEQRAIKTGGAGDPYIIPNVESDDTINRIDEILEIPGLKIITLGLTDCSRLITGKVGVEHPAVWKWVDRVVKVAQPKGIVVCANTGYYLHDPQNHVRRIKELVDHGVRMIFISSATHILQGLLGEMMTQIKKEVPGV
ncbi:MAG: hypothetical protein HYX90_08790 [Chloroflexi bacterium]|nr:hypothetical protein [Chloroflexota bacterium]